MSISELANEPIEITLGGRTLKIKRLTLKELFTPAEVKVQEKYIHNANLMASTMTGKEKAEFLDRALNSVPSGKKLDEMAGEYMSTAVGVSDTLLMGLNKCQEVTEAEISDMILNATETELMFIRDYLSGDKADPEAKKKLELLKMVEPKPVKEI